MPTITLTFKNDEKLAAHAAIHALDLLGAIAQIDAAARSALKYDGDPLATLESIRAICAEARERLSE